MKKELKKANLRLKKLRKYMSKEQRSILLMAQELYSIIEDIKEIIKEKEEKNTN